MCQRCRYFITAHSVVRGPRRITHSNQIIHALQAIKNKNHGAPQSISHPERPPESPLHRGVSATRASSAAPFTAHFKRIREGNQQQQQQS